jgi:hypothetical protein
MVECGLRHVRRIIGRQRNGTEHNDRKTHHETYAVMAMGSGDFATAGGEREDGAGG